jgi:NAD(P)H dehydrogenase (quinone)
MPANRTLLVTGAAGHLGRSVVEALIEANAGKLIATTRDPAKLADLKARGVEVRRADFSEPASLAAAFAGAERMLLISTDVIHTPGLRLSQHRNAVRAAVEAGVKHVVYTSAPAPYPKAGGSLIDDHFWTEQALIASPLEWTILRHHMYAENLLGTLPNAIKTGSLVSAAADGGTSYVTRADCARADAGALNSDWSGRRILDVTGPAPVTRDQVAAIAAELTGRKIKHVPISAEAYARQMASAGLPPFVIDVLLGFDLQAAQGYHAIVTSAVKDLSGRAPTALKDFLTAHRAILSGSS